MHYESVNEEVPVSNKSKVIQCRWCGWKTLKFKTLKSGETRGPTSAFGKLREHVANCHGDEQEAARILDLLDDD